MDAGEGSERWGGDIDFNDWSHGAETTSDGPRWEPTPPTRWNGRRIALIVGSALAVTLLGIGGVLGVMSLIGGDEISPEDQVAQPSNADGTVTDIGDVAEPPPLAAPVSLEWYAVDGTLGFVNRIAAGADGSFYTLSTAPGRGFDVWPPVRAIYHTTDGEAWDFAILGEDISGADMALRDGTIYLIGTAPGFGGFGEPPVVVINESSDSGVSWDQTSLPTIATPPIGGGDGWTETSMNVAATNAGLVAVVQTNFWIDYWSLVPQGLLGEWTDVQPTETGVDIIDQSIYDQLEQECEAAGGFREDVDGEEMPEPCRQLMTGDVETTIVQSLTWEELGIEGGQPVFSEVFVSADGAEWESIESPFAAGRTLANLYSTGRGFIAAQWADFGGYDIWTSRDGRTWESADVPDLDWIVAAGTVGGNEVILGAQMGRAVAAWSNGSGGWETIDIATQLDPAPAGQQTWLAAGGVGPLGVVAVMQSEGDGVGLSGPGLFHGTAADDWNWIPLDTLVGQGFGFSDWVAVGPDQVLARFVENGPQQQINLQLVGLPE